MEIKKLTESAILSSVFIVLSMIFISTGIMYTTYLDIIVPSFIAIIYIRCGFKYTSLAMITVTTIVAFVLGDIASALWMSQSMLIGVACGYILNKSTTIFDDMLILCIVSAIIIISIDIYLSKFIGFSVIQTSKESLDISKSILEPYGFYISEEMSSTIVNILITTIPVGTGMMCYFITLLFGNRLNILTKNIKPKFLVLKNIRVNLSNVYCSRKVTINSIFYLLIMTMIDSKDIVIPNIHLSTLLQVIKYIIYYFIIRDAICIIRGYIYYKTNAAQNAVLSSFLILILLVNNFTFTFWSITLMAFVYVPIKMNNLIKP